MLLPSPPFTESALVLRLSVSAHLCLEMGGNKQEVGRRAAAAAPHIPGKSASS